MAHPGAVDVVDTGDRAVFHREGEARLGVEPEREAERGADGAAMRDGDDVAAAMGLDQRMDRPRDALHHIDEALAAGRGLMRRRVPEAMKRAAAGVPQLVISEALPLAKALLGEIGNRRRI